MATITKHDFIPLTSVVALAAGQSGAEFDRIASAGNASSVRVSIESLDGQKTTVSLPEGTLALIASVLREVSHGRSVSVVSSDAELTTQEAANMLNVSRPYLVKLLSRGKIPYRSVGVRRRILLSDLLDYKEKESARRHAILEEMVVENQRLGLY